MNRKLKLAFTGLAVLGLAACASVPQQRYSTSIKAAQAAKQPLLVYGIEGGYSTKPNSRFLTSRFLVRPASKYYVGIGFMNTTTQSIKKLTFTLTADHDRQPVLGAIGEPLRAQVTAVGPFPLGTAQVSVMSPSSWAGMVLPRDTCLHVSGIEVTYANQTSYVVSQQEARQYLTPDARAGVRCAYFRRHGPAGGAFMRPTFQVSVPVR